ncbi:MAG TPA: MarR family winged helix-turn-helix transcriptional regulator [Acetobacteraceae bacterium]|jgi:DNA-binding MarR family transcriptional regulator|nr:MarR family winged helix-turn-helix transcriptional regulator [Acetobacteraceae bacterium]
MSRPRQPKRNLRADLRAAVENCAAWSSRLAARRITQFLDRAMAESPLGVAQLGLLAQIAVATDDTLGGLARRTGLDQSTLSRNLRTLQSAGLVEIAVVESDLRRRTVWLTESGLRRLEAALPAWRAAQAKLAARVPPALAHRLAEATEALENDTE